MSKPFLIGLTGHKGAGKDATAKFLAPYNYVRVAFADPVREMALAIDPWIPVVIGDDGDVDFKATAQLRETPVGVMFPPVGTVLVRLSALVEKYGWDKVKTIPEVRRLLQVIGTEAVRNIVGEDTWVNIAMRKIVEQLDEGHNVVVTDVRFPNEAERIREVGGHIWRVVRAGQTSTDGHVSEAFADTIPADRTLKAGTLAELQAATELALN